MNRISIFLLAFLITKITHFATQIAGVPLTLIHVEDREQCKEDSFVLKDLLLFDEGTIVEFLDNDQVLIDGKVYDTINIYRAE
jgi:hypothetical protein